MDSSNLVAEARAVIDVVVDVLQGAGLDYILPQIAAVPTFQTRVFSRWHPRWQQNSISLAASRSRRQEIADCLVTGQAAKAPRSRFGGTVAELISLASARGPLARHVIFVHGLGGDPRGTWTSLPPPPPQNRIWPTWLAEDLEGLAVWSVGYEAPVSNWRGSAMDLADRAQNVLSLLLARGELQTGELIFVGHSLGGLVIKQILRKAADASAARADAYHLVDRTRKVAFMATPHTGADLARWGDRLRILIRPTDATRSLVRNDSHLRDLNLWYRRWATHRMIDHLILYEKKETSLFGMIVKPDTSDPGLSSDPVPIDADHIMVAKPQNRESQIYLLIREFLARTVEGTITREEKKIDSVKYDTQRIRKAVNEPLEEEIRKRRAQLIDLDRMLTPAGLARETSRINGLSNVEWSSSVVKRDLEAERALTQANLGNALMSSTSDAPDAKVRIKDAATAFREALKLWTPEEKPILWAAANCSLGGALGALGGTEHLQEAAAAFEQGLKVWKREHNPNEWASAQLGLGMSLMTLGGTADLEKAVAAFRAALEIFTSSSEPAFYAEIQKNLTRCLELSGRQHHQN